MAWASPRVATRHAWGRALQSHLPNFRGVGTQMAKSKFRIQAQAEEGTQAPALVAGEACSRAGDRSFSWTAWVRSSKRPKIILPAVV